MATALAVLSALVALVPVFVEAYRAKRDRHTKATDAIRARDLAELRAGLERLRAVREHKTHKPVLEGREDSL